MKVILVTLVLAVQLLKVHASEKADDPLMDALKELYDQFQELKSSCKVTKVAFSAALRPSVVKKYGLGAIGPYTSNTILKHTHVITNVGNAYSPQTGVFRAPVKGVYFFTFTTYSWVKEADIGVSLYRNNDEILLIHEWQDAGDNEDFATNSASLVLQPGDTVYINLPKGLQVAASIKSNLHTFSGFLLYML